MDPAGPVLQGLDQAMRASDRVIFTGHTGKALQDALGAERLAREEVQGLDHDLDVVATVREWEAEDDDDLVVTALALGETQLGALSEEVAGAGAWLDEAWASDRALSVSVRGVRYRLVSGVGAFATGTTRDLNGLLVLPSTVAGCGLVGIGPGAFEDSRIERLYVPAPVRSIGARAFAGNTELTGVVLPRGLRMIGDEAFSGCSNLQQVRVPESTESLGSRAFARCTALTRVALPSTLQHVTDDLFSGCDHELVVSVQSESLAQTWAVGQDVVLHVEDQDVLASPGFVPYGVTVDTLEYAVTSPLGAELAAVTQPLQTDRRIDSVVDGIPVTGLGQDSLAGAGPEAAHLRIPSSITWGAARVAGTPSAVDDELLEGEEPRAQDAEDELTQTADAAAQAPDLGSRLERAVSDAETVRLSLRMVCDLLDIEVPEELEAQADDPFTLISAGTPAAVGGLYFTHQVSGYNQIVQRLIDRGVGAFVSNRALFDAEGNPLPCLVVKHPEAAYIQVASAISDLYGAKRIAVTGSAGKSTTKHMLQLVSAVERNTYSSRSDQNGLAQVGRHVQRLSEDTEVYIQETGAGRPGQVEKSAQILHPDAFVLTNIGLNHVSNYGGSQEALLADKASLDRHLPDDGVVFINYDDPKLRKLPLRHRAISYAADGHDADYTAQDIVERDGQLLFTVTEASTGQKTDLVINTFGLHNVSNALATFAVARWLGISAESIASGLSEYREHGTRKNLIQVGDRRVLVDGFNATESGLASTAAALTTLVPLRQGRRVYVVADIDDKLGHGIEEVHRRVGRMLAEQSEIDEIVFFGESMGFAAEEARKALAGQGPTLFTTVDRSALHAHLREVLGPDDVVAFKGGQQMALPITIDTLFGTGLVTEDDYILQSRGKPKKRDAVRYRAIDEFGCEVVGLGRDFLGTQLVIAPEVSREPVYLVGKLAFHRSELTAVALPEPLRTIGVSAFYRSSKLRWVILPRSLRVIERSAFNACTNLRQLSVPEGVVSVGDRAFYACRRLRRITLPASVQLIGEEAFEKCRDLVVTCVEGSYAHEFLAAEYPETELELVKG